MDMYSHRMFSLSEQTVSQGTDVVCQSTNLSEYSVPKHKVTQSTQSLRIHNLTEYTVSSKQSLFREHSLSFLCTVYPL
jgi:hypothetical protein